MSNTKITGQPRMMKLLRAERCLAPSEAGGGDILIAGRTILAVGKLGIDFGLPPGIDVEVMEAGPGSTAVPGFIDHHVHLIGGGGEAGPHTRVPEITLSEITGCGVTTVVGVLGTDDVTRHPEALLAKARALEHEGITAFVLSGAYALPTPTLTGSVKRDIVLVDRVLGAGEIAISDYRSSHAPYELLRSVASECRVGGLLGGKAGILHLHVGDEEEGLAPLRRLIADGAIHPRQVIPTHVNRSERLFEQAKSYLGDGGWIDLTAFDFPGCDALSPVEAVRRLKEAGLPLERVTISSDANGSMALRGPDGWVVGYRVARMRTLLANLREIIAGGVLTIEEAVSLVSANVARFLGLASQKGFIAAGFDADITVFGPNLEIEYVLAKGRVMVERGVPIVRGTFE